MVFGQRLHHAQDSFDSLDDDWRCCRKYNGHSVLWLPEYGLFTIGRKKTPVLIEAPSWWLNNLPKFPAHGELWTESDSSEVVSALVSSGSDESWSELKLVVFGFPESSGVDPSQDSSWSGLNGLLPFRFSLKNFRDNFQNEYCFSPEYFDCFVDPRSKGWEGCVFQNMSAPYKIGRTKNVLKWKPYYEDEAVILGYNVSKSGKVTLLCEYFITEKNLSVYGGASLVVGNKVLLRLPVKNKEESKIDIARELYPIGSEVPFKYESFSVSGNFVNADLFFGGI
jgi:hypothetical protein